MREAATGLSSEGRRILALGRAESFADGILTLSFAGGAVHDGDLRLLQEENRSLQSAFQMLTGDWASSVVLKQPDPVEPEMPAGNGIAAEDEVPAEPADVSAGEVIEEETGEFAEPPAAEFAGPSEPGMDDAEGAGAIPPAGDPGIPEEPVEDEPMNAKERPRHSVFEERGVLEEVSADQTVQEILTLFQGRIMDIHA